MYKKWQMVMGWIFTIGIILLISQLSTGSLNPLEVFKGDSLFLKIVVGVLLGLLALNLLTMPFRGSLKGKACLACGKSLLDFAGPLGNPMKCNFCGRWYHKNCFKAGGGTIWEGCKRPGCSTYRGDTL
jgi:hypothetical protein